MRLTLKLVLPVMLVVEIVVYLYMPSGSVEHLQLGILNTGLILPAILGVVLRWLYQYEAKQAFRTVSDALLAVSCLFYGLYTLFILFVIISWGNSVTSTSGGSGIASFFYVVGMFLPFVINVYLLYGYRADKTHIQPLLALN